MSYTGHDNGSSLATASEMLLYGAENSRRLKENQDRRKMILKQNRLIQRKHRKKLKRQPQEMERRTSEKKEYSVGNTQEDSHPEIESLEAHERVERVVKSPVTETRLRSTACK
jgi:hypothetical protein